MTRRTFIAATGCVSLSTFFSACSDSNDNRADFPVEIVLETQERQIRLNNGTILEIDSHNQRLLHENSDGTLIRSLGEPWVFDENNSPSNYQFNRPTKALMLDDDSYIILDSRNGRVIHYDSDGSYMYSYSGDHQYPLRYPTDILLHNGILYLCDALGSVQAYDPLSAKQLMAFGKRGVATGELNAPSALSIDSQGRFHVVCKGSHDIRVFSEDGSYLQSYGEDLNYPSLIAIDTNRDVIFSADQYDATLHLYDANFKLMQTLELKDNQGNLMQPLSMQLVYDKLYCFVNRVVMSGAKS